MPVRFAKGQPQYLLLRQNSGHWSFPKGHGEEGETAQESALREFREETGLLDCRIFEDFPPVTIRYRFRRPDGLHEKRVLLFGGESPEGDVSPQAEEIQAYGWFTFEEALEILSEFKKPVSADALIAFHAFLRTR